MLKKRIISIVLFILLVGDFSFSFMQYCNTPLYGDLASHVLPDKIIQKVIDDPFGFHSLSTGEKHSNPNRFFSHIALMKYFQHVPLLLQKYVSPIKSVYLASALIKIAVQLVFVFLLAAFISGKKNPFNRAFLLSAILIAPLFQVYGFWSRMGIVDKSVAYTFFYGLPLVLLMLFFLPIFDMKHSGKKIKSTSWIFLTPLIIILPLSGPLVPAVILIVALLIIADYYFRSTDKKLFATLKSVPKPIYGMLIPICLVSLYSLFLGFYNSNYDSQMISIWERYKRLPEGLYSQVFHSLGVPLMLIMIGINTFLIKRENQPDGIKLTRNLGWIGVFTVIYILLLPFGGYRPYRPYIIRYDTFMPVTIALIYYFGTSAWYLMNHLGKKKLRPYMIGLLVVLLVFTSADFKGFGSNKCEKMAFHIMANSTKNVVEIPKDCFVLDWDNKFDPRQTEKEARLIYKWNITTEKKLYYNKK